jgi:hypothetical protein
MTTLFCEHVPGLAAAVEQTQAIFIGLVAAAHDGLQSGRLMELRVGPRLASGAQFALVTLADRAEAPVMAQYPGLMAERLQQGPSNGISG